MLLPGVPDSESPPGCQISETSFPAPCGGNTRTGILFHGWGDAKENNTECAIAKNPFLNGTGARAWNGTGWLKTTVRRELCVRGPDPNGPWTHSFFATNKKKPTAKKTRITVLSISPLARSIFGHRLGVQKAASPP